MRNFGCVHALLLLCLLCARKSYAQDSTLHKIISLPDQLLSTIDKKTTATANKLDQQSKKYLARLQRQEGRLKRKLLKKDSLLAKELFLNLESQYAALQTVPQNVGKYACLYSGHLDSLTTALNFLKNSEAAAWAGHPQVNKTLGHLQGLQGRLNQSDQIQRYLAERQGLLKESFQKLGMVRELKRFNKQVYYYGAQAREYKALFEDPNKIEAKLIEVLTELPQFKDFFARNSQLGSLFALPTSDGSFSASAQGLQTRAMLNEQLAQRFGTGAAVTQQLQQNVQAAQASLSALKDKASSYASGGTYGNTSGDLEQPDFKPNTQKTKSFLQRLEYGGNLQTQKARNYFPQTADIAATLAYRLGNQNVAGVAVSYKLGLGQGWNNIQLTHQGVGLRSFIDWKIKGSFYATAGYEQNYRSDFTRVEQLKQYRAWQSSGLVGLTKKYSISKKLRGNMQLLWDFLSYQQTPRVSQPLLFRVGYTFK